MTYKKNIIVLLITALCLIIGCKKIDINRKAKIVTSNVSINNTSIIAEGEIIDLLENIETSAGFCWSEMGNPSVNFNDTIIVSRSAKKGIFLCEIRNLIFGKEYYVRAFLQNKHEIVYGNVIKIIPSSLGISVITGNVNFLDDTSININSAINNMGSLLIQKYGHCWSLSSNVTYNNSHSSINLAFSGLNYSDTIFPLFLSKTYYVRGYAVLNDSTILYGDVKSFSIPDLIVKTDTFTQLNSTTVSLKGAIQQFGLHPIINHGFCWSLTTSYPTYNDNLIQLGTTNQIGSFYNQMNNVIIGSRYYFRAYATDGRTVHYGKIITFIL